MKTKTKIVATLGPASNTAKEISELIKLGLSVARLNMSHGSHEEHGERLKQLDLARKATRVEVASLLDLAGPKIRTGDVKGGEVTLKKGSDLRLVFSPVLGDEKTLYINYPKLRNEVKPGMFILLDDGKKKLKVISVGKDFVDTKVEVGGMIRSRRGVNIPGANLSISAITEKDKKDLVFGVKNGVDFVALSSVRSVKDIRELRSLLNKLKSEARMVAKIETPEALLDIDAIMEETDAIMVARGDLAIEVGIEKIPTVQKNLISRCNSKGKPVIVATQMLMSMVENATPTRAEVSDIANAIYDGADAIMLSEETAVGKFPKKAVEVMNRVASEVETGLTMHKHVSVMKGNIADSVSSSVIHNAEEVGAKAIIALTQSGFTARMLARYRSPLPVYAISSSIKTIRTLNLSFGVIPTFHKGAKKFEEARAIVSGIARSSANLKTGDSYIVCAGLMQGRSGATNMMLIENV